jgi:hypothetical protein
MDTNAVLETLQTLQLEGMAAAFEEMLTKTGSRNVDPVEWIKVMAASEDKARAERRF